MSGIPTFRDRTFREYFEPDGMRPRRCLSVRLSARKISAATKRTFIALYFQVLSKKSVEEIQVSLNLTTITALYMQTRAHL
jgi:hypothetical protein